jgi:putative endopeptidase
MKCNKIVFLFFIATFLINYSFIYSQDKNGKEINVANMDTTVSPAVDFYKYANGNWINNTPIPPEYPMWGSFTILGNENYDKLKEILGEVEKNTSAPEGSNEQLVGNFYFSGMDSIKIENDGFKPVIADLQRVEEMKSKEDFYKALGRIHLGFSNPFFSFSSTPDAKNSEMVIAQIYQDGLGLPNRDYYLKEDENSKTIRAAYKEFIKKIFALLKVDSITTDKYADVIMNIETNLAKASMSRVEERDPQKTYHKMSIKQLSEIAPDFNWEIYFTSLGVNNVGNINVSQPDFIKEVNELVKTLPIDDIKIYLKWNTIRFASPYLSNDFVQTNFNFYSKTINGVQSMQPRWKRILGTIDRKIGMSLGQLFVKIYFPPEAKGKALNLVHNLISVLSERIKRLDWMSNTTKEKAQKKLSAIMIKIGYPDKWKSYKGLNIVRDSYYENVINSTIFDSQKDLAKIGKPVDKSEWEMTPSTVNAYYNPLVNEIVFPAGILQPPFFDPDADNAINYGGIGVVIGHEMTHGFDDEGRQFDASGNLQDWWTKEDEVKFNQRAEKIIKQFNSYIAIDTLHVNGNLTEGENIADLGGINISFEAFCDTKEFKEGKLIDGFTPEKRFFLSYANVWRSALRPQYLTMLVKTNPHSPPQFRVNGPLSNFPPFWSAFGVKPGDPLRNPDDKLVKIW